MSRRHRRVPGEVYLPGLTRGTLTQLGATPIAAYVGFNGSGKTLAAVAAAMAHLEAGRPVLSTVRLLDYRDPRPCEDQDCTSPRHGLDEHRAAHPLWVPMTDFRQLLDFEAGHVLMDEVTGVADAREHASMPVQVANLLPQLRRRDVTLAWTTIQWSFADVRLRRLTLAATWSVGLRPVYEPGAMWPRHRWFYWRTYDAANIVDDFHMGNRGDMKALNRVWFRRPGSLVQEAYDTTDQVLTLGAASEAGMCLTCGGKRTMPRCSCSSTSTTRRAAPIAVGGPAAA